MGEYRVAPENQSSVKLCYQSYDSCRVLWSLNHSTEYTPGLLHPLSTPLWYSTTMQPPVFIIIAFITLQRVGPLPPVRLDVKKRNIRKITGTAWAHINLFFNNRIKFNNLGFTFLLRLAPEPVGGWDQIKDSSSKTSIRLKTLNVTFCVTFKRLLVV